MAEKKGVLRFKGNVKPAHVIDSLAQGKILSKRTHSALEEKEVRKSDKKDFNLKRDEATAPSQTPSEIIFNSIRKKRMLERVEKKVQTSYKEKTEKFSQNLAKLPEHFDIPKVGPG